jgi:hypothetical protein
MAIANINSPHNTLLYLLVVIFDSIKKKPPDLDLMACWGFLSCGLVLGGVSYGKFGTQSGFVGFISLFGGQEWMRDHIRTEAAIGADKADYDLILRLWLGLGSSHSFRSSATFDRD